MAHLYFAEALADDAFRVGNVIDVTGEEAHHAVRVSRLRVGEVTLVGNGRGSIASGTVTHTDRDRFVVDVRDVYRTDPPTQRLVLIQALAKGDRDARAVEQATEFGVDDIIPWEAVRSISRWGAQKADRGVEKWQRIAREAAKQSLRAWIPKVHPPTDAAGIERLTAAGPVFVLHPDATEPFSGAAREVAKDSLASVPTVSTPPAPDFATTLAFHLVIGPEGGIDPDELARFAAAGARQVRLGDDVLRTSSAGPAALAVLNTVLGRW